MSSMSAALAKLNARVKPLADAPQELSAKPENVGATPKAELRQPLEWLKPVVTGPGTATMKTACGLFRIDKVASQLSVGYTCWKLSLMPGALNERLGCADDPEKAKALCNAALMGGKP